VGVVARSRPVDQPDVIRLGLLPAADRQARAHAEQRGDPDELPGREGDTAADDRGGDLGQVIALDPLGDVLRRRTTSCPSTVASPASFSVSGRMPV